MRLKALLRHARRFKLTVRALRCGDREKHYSNELKYCRDGVYADAQAQGRSAITAEIYAGSAERLLWS